MTSSNQNSSRLISLDALRGFDMIWILGAEGIFHALFILTGWQIWQSLAEQFKHSDWHGITFYDLIFPLFIFLSGVTLGISKRNLIDADSNTKVKTYKKAITRLLLLCFFGVLYNHGWGQGIPANPENIRYASVLMRIGIAWFFTALIVWHFHLKVQLMIALLIPLIYWFFQNFVPLPNGEIGVLTKDNSWNAVIDQCLLPGITYQNSAADPEGILSHLSAVFNGLCGALFGRYLTQHQSNIIKRLSMLIIFSVALGLVGYLWAIIYPLNKNLWTGSFALVTSAYSGLLLCFFYWFFDIKNHKAIAYFFAVIGANAILLYLLSSLINWNYFVQSLIGGIIENYQTSFGPLLGIFMLVASQWFVAHFLYKKKIFLKV